MRRFRRFAAVLAVSAVLPGCAKLSMYDLTDQFGFLHSYEAAKSDFDRGRIMEARAEVLAIDKSRSDYRQAQALLKNKIEPARLRLLRHYASEAATAEHHGDWNAAMGLYEQAAGFSISPAYLQRKQHEMSLKMRQVRMNALLDQRRHEDAAILSWQSSYEPPKGVDANDMAFLHERENYASMLDGRASDAYSAAKSYLHKGMPDLAYVEIESYLRYEPDSEQGKKLMAEIRKQMPQGLHISSEKAPPSHSRVPAGPMVRQPEPNSVKIEDIRKLMAQKHWLKAKQLAQVYRREGGAGAAALLEKIQAEIAAAAAAEFQQGSISFRKENIDAAVVHWNRAVQMMPDNSQYVDALQRARQLQERLRILRESAADNAPKSGESAPAGK